MTQKDPQIAARLSDHEEIQSLRQELLRTLSCQFVRYSIIPRGLADVYATCLQDQVIGYAGIWNRHFPGRLMEFHVSPQFEERGTQAFRKVLEASGATAVEAQTNLPGWLHLAQAFCSNLTTENWLFEAGAPPEARRTDVVFRRRRAKDVGPGGEWVLEAEGRILAAGGILTHYNPPYGDIYLTVSEPERRRGLGSFLVQELSRTCLESGLQPAARCDATNEASRRTLLRGGLSLCGSIVAGPVDAAIGRL